MTQNATILDYYENSCENSCSLFHTGITGRFTRQLSYILHLLGNLAGKPARPARMRLSLSFFTTSSLSLSFFFQL